ncbi:MAG TPA: 16S rRNA (cytosine(967)-C(5))-methyltransferase RsmB, partial [bacterium]|nr:16S rRNA (cytosine(967)-C(5))-methyltransferase RsmB [bacterium]
DPTLSGAPAPDPGLPIPETAPVPEAVPASAAAAPPPAKPDPRDEACRLLVRLDSPEARARELVDEALRSLPFGPEDAALLQELVHGTLRQRGLLDWRLSQVSHRPLEALSPWVRALLRLSLYQVLCLDRIPAGAAVDAACEIARRHGHDGVVKFVNGCLREICRQKAENKLQPLPAHPVLRLAIESSHPVWMAERLTDSFGWERAAQALAASNVAPPLTLRVNPQRARRDEVASRLHQAGFHVEPCRYSPWGLRVKEAVDTRRLPGFLDGDFHVQDESAQLAGLLLGVQPDWQVADVCAAPGGKLCLLAELLGKGGRLWAFDRKAGSLEKIQSTLRRQGIQHLACETRDALSPKEELAGRMDAVLVDAPCSALGVLRRRAEARWQLRPESLPVAVERQARLLAASARYLKPGGVLVYTVNSWDEDEGEGVVARFLERNPGFSFERASQFLPHEVCTRDGFLRVWPGQDGMDGVFAARLRKVA